MTYQFGDFRLDPAERRLTREQLPVSLTPKAFDLLVYLVERQGKLVEKSTLMSALWPDTIVEEANLAFQISALRKALGDGGEGEGLIQTVPTKGYRFVAAVTTTARPKDVEKAPSAAWRWLAATVLAVALYFGFKHFFAPPAARTTPDAAMRVVPLTTLRGSESWPEFSPDGTQVAFTWDGGVSGANEQVYITLVGGGGSRQLTSDPRFSYSAPSWSPDGRQIAVGRCLSEHCDIRLLSPLGGQDTKFNDSRLVGKPAWSPDGRLLAAALAPSSVAQGAGIFLLPVAGGDVRRLTGPAVAGFDHSPAFSPDGRSLAYVSCVDTDGSDCDVFVTAITPAMKVSGTPHRVTHDAGKVRGLAWTASGTALVYGQAGAVDKLYRVSVASDGAPARLEIAGFGATQPATSPRGDLLAFKHNALNLDVYKLRAGRPPEPVVTSSFADELPAVSPDGHRIAFCTSRSTETYEVWVSSADGSGAQQLTHGPGFWQCSPHWSPDGKAIAFNSQGADRHWHIWTIDAEGGTPTQLTSGPGSDQIVATWSQDGAWVYFSASGAIWKVRLTDRHAEQVTKAIVRKGETAAYAAESADGKELLYQVGTEISEGAVVALPLGGGAPHNVVPCAWNDAFADSIQGFYYAGCGEGRSRQVHLLDRRTGRDRVLFALDAWDGPIFGMPISPDGSNVYYTKDVSPHSDDLMVIENFK